MDPRHFDTDPDSTFLPDADPESAYHRDADPDSDPDHSFQIRAQTTHEKSAKTRSYSIHLGLSSED